MSAVAGSLSRKNSVDFFVAEYEKEAATFGDNGPKMSQTGQPLFYKGDLIQGLVEKNKHMMDKVNRRVLKNYHPDDKNNADKIAADPNFANTIGAARNKYERGRERYMKSSAAEQLESMVRNNLDTAQRRQMSTKFHYDLRDEHGQQILYTRAMGDIFYHPERDVVTNQPIRQVPQDFANPNTNVGALHRHFREYRISAAYIRNTLIDLYLKATPKQLDELDTIRQYSQIAIEDSDNPIRSVKDLIAACRKQERNAYLRGLGVMTGIDDINVKRRVEEFFARRPLTEIHKLKGYIIRACEKQTDDSMDNIVQSAHKDLIFDNIVTNNRIAPSPVSKEAVFNATFIETPQGIIGRPGRISQSSPAYENSFQNDYSVIQFAKGNVNLPEFMTKSEIDGKGWGYMIGPQAQTQFAYIQHGLQNGETVFRRVRLRDNPTISPSYFAGRS